MKNIRVTTGTVILSLAVILFLVDMAFAESIKIIVNNKIAESSLSKDDVKNIYVGNKTKWGNNETIVVAIVKDEDVHDSFLKEFVGRTSSQFTTTWKKMMFTGKGKTPTKCDSLAAMVEFISKNEGAIGYITGDTAVSGDVKVITLN